MRLRSHQHELATSSVIVVDLSPAAAAAHARRQPLPSRIIAIQLCTDFADKFVIDGFV